MNQKVEAKVDDLYKVKYQADDEAALWLLCTKVVNTKYYFDIIKSEGLGYETQKKHFFQEKVST